MKRLILFIVILCGAVAIWTVSNKPTEVPGTIPSPSPDVLSYPSTTYASAWAGPFDGEQVELQLNLAEKNIATQLRQEKQCEFLVNAGFYTKDNKPIGLFVQNSEVIRNEVSSSLFDGFITINDLRIPRITREYPRDTIIYGLQTGPFLVENGKLTALKIKNDREARRMVALVDGQNKLYFAAFYDKNSLFRGPLLAELPDIVLAEAKNRNIEIADAINLDGGSASAFVSRDEVLTELSPIGSFFCVK